MKNILLFGLFCSSLFLSGYSADIKSLNPERKEEKSYEIILRWLEMI